MGPTLVIRSCEERVLAVVLAVMAIAHLYQDKFDTTAYLKLHDFRKSLEAGRMEHALTFYHDSFINIPSGVKVLDYGTGPVLLSTYLLQQKLLKLYLLNTSKVTARPSVIGLVAT